MNNDLLFSKGLYKGAEFKFTITIPLSYPYDPPKAQCNTMVNSLKNIFFSKKK